MKGIFITTLFALSLGGGGTFLWLYYGGFHGEDSSAIAFINMYGDYKEVADHVEALVHLPGTEGNTDRAELLTLLNSILTENMTPERRESLARIAFTNLDSIKKEIDEAQVAQAQLYEILQDLDNSARLFSSIELRNKSSEIVALARKKAEISARITSILSEINEHTYAIITKILSENGELSNMHIIDINNSTMEAEKRFETLEGLYSELIEKGEEINVMFQEFARISL